MKTPKYHVASWHFHWKFWRPKQCIGGPVYFGWWATAVDWEGKDPSAQTPFQVERKREWGWLEQTAPKGG